MTDRERPSYSLPASYVASSQPIDPEALARLRADVAVEPAMFDEIIGQFIGELGPRLDAIGGALDAADPPQLADAAHRLKGGSLLVGARGMAEVCLQIELAARAGGLDDARALFNLLREEAARVRQALATAQSA
jgi:HPt (histidine-containing phosphotransfer) domain-containing protein